MEEKLKLERRKSSASTTLPKKATTRTPSAHGNRAPPRVNTNIQADHPTHFGIPTPMSNRDPALVSHNSKLTQPTYAPTLSQPLPLRPRAVTAQTYPPRPISCHGIYGPVTTAGFHNGPPIAPSGYFQPHMATPSYPPPSPSSTYMRYAATPQPQQEYFPPTHTLSLTGRPLSSRFDSVQRTSSEYGTRDSMPHYNPIQPQIEAESFDAGYYSGAEGPVALRRSVRPTPTRAERPLMRIRAEADLASPDVRPLMYTRGETDSDKMPPPPVAAPRAGILRKKTTDYYVDPLPIHDRRHSRTIHREAPASRHTSTHRNLVSYDLEIEGLPARVETANTSARRERSYYGSGPSADSGFGSGAAWEEQTKAAQNYQADVGASINPPLTQEALRRAQRPQGQAVSSRTSSGSHSEYSDSYGIHPSATTRTTRSGSGHDQVDDIVTIRAVNGGARVTIDNTEIVFSEGGEVQVQRQKSIRNGSERSGSVYGSSQIDDRVRRPRVDPSTGRSQRSSVGEQFRRPHPGTDYTREGAPF
ncbi:hypothetical protein BJ878DRAFT_429085 [Calycina marina]|uniref:Uncharacterized protein n=1 Tax=Calycina marina TaxID=1763456 RepID=A0A9P7YXM1_9HELO|nr:hypothetical protein BJ878DRAFT_429085 [Calycina marina]